MTLPNNQLVIFLNIPKFNPKASEETVADELEGWHDAVRRVLTGDSSNHA